MGKLLILLSRISDVLIRILLKFKAYFDLTKAPAIVLIVLVTWMGGLLSQPKNLSGDVGLKLGVALIFIAISAAGSLALNQWMEWRTDALMERTKVRPIPSGRLSANEALVFGLLLFLIPLPILTYWASLQAALATFFCGAIYLLGYTILKSKSSWSTWVGAIPGALLPWMGWSIFDRDYTILFWDVVLILYFWQIPHTLIISLKNFQDYQNCGMKLFPMFAGEMNTRLQVFFQSMLLNILVLVPILIGESGPKYRIICLIVVPLTSITSFLYWKKPTPFIDKLAFRSGLSFIPLVIGALVLERL
jgi:protoheme IX farnesyltransferase|tara:strand:- start:3221 stop:4135 length:915 start_codon:yes stop_codon:yes gene_type:complete